MMQLKQIIASPLSMLSKQVFPFQKMMQSKQIIASLFSNSFEHVSNMAGLGWANKIKNRNPLLKI
jgi:hypothetical protein